MTQTNTASDTGLLVACPACEGEGFLGGMGTSSECVFCLGERKVSSAEARRYDPEDPLRGAEPTLRRLNILYYQLDPWPYWYLRLHPDRRDDVLCFKYVYQGKRAWLDHYGVTLEQLRAEFDDDELEEGEIEEELDQLWGMDGRDFSGEDFSADSSTSSGRWTEDDTWDEVDFSGSILAGAIFHEVDLTGSVFDGANLTEANLTGAKLTRVSFRGADVTGADFRGAKSLEPQMLADLRARGAIVDEPGN